MGALRSPVMKNKLRIHATKHLARESNPPKESTHEPTPNGRPDVEPALDRENRCRQQIRTASARRGQTGPIGESIRMYHSYPRWRQDRQRESVLNLIALAVHEKKVLEILVEGPGAQKAMDAVRGLVRDKFGERNKSISDSSPLKEGDLGGVSLASSCGKD